MWWSGPSVETGGGGVAGVAGVRDEVRECGALRRLLRWGVEAAALVVVVGEGGVVDGVALVEAVPGDGDLKAVGGEWCVSQQSE